MSGYNEYSDDFDFDNEAGQRGGGGLRKMLEESLAENKRLREAIEGKERETSATALLKEKGIDPAVANIIPKDANPAEWVEQNAHLFAHAPVEDEEVTDTNTQSSDDDDPAVIARKAELAAEQKALADMQDAAESGFISTSVHDDLLSKMDKIDSEEELLKFFNENGAPVSD